MSILCTNEFYYNVIAIKMSKFKVVVFVVNYIGERLYRLLVIFYLDIEKSFVVFISFKVVYEYIR